MEKTEDEIIEKYAKQFLHCNQNTLLPYENHLLVSRVDIT